ncbi:MAG: hypothetical protein AB7P21_10185 [Lautropia sp.]
MARTTFHGDGVRDRTRRRASSLVAAMLAAAPVAHAEEAFRIAAGAGSTPASVSASVRIQVVVEPRLQLSEGPARLSLASNRGSVLIACDDPAGCAARAIGDRGIVAGSIASPAGRYTVAQP